MGCHNTFNFIYSDPGQLAQAMRGMVFNNVSSFQQQAGASIHPQSVGGILPNYYQERLEFHPNSNGQYNSMLQYQPQSRFHQPLSLPPSSSDSDGYVGSINSLGSYTGDPKLRDGQAKPSSDERGLLPKTILLPSRTKNTKSNPKTRFVCKRRELEVHKVLCTSPVPKNQNQIHGKCDDLI
jgi:hypothetical protein